MESSASPLHRRQSVTIRRVDHHGRNEALSVLLTGRPVGAEQAVSSFQELSAAEQVVLDSLWAAYRGGEPVASVLLVPGAGRVAMAFISPMLGHVSVGEMADLVRAACRDRSQNGVRMTQALLDPLQQLESCALARAGFHRLAELVYMQCSCQDLSGQGVLPDTFTVRTWRRAHRPLFERAILASYRDTLDCPKLVGVRTIDDVIAGHMATGCFRADMWFVLMHGPEPVAVMLLNPVSRPRTVELVYLGVCPAWRGSGVGGGLLRQGLWSAAQRRMRTMVLAVDRSNTPAIGLYRQVGFTPTTSKLAMVLTLP